VGSGHGTGSTSIGVSSRTRLIGIMSSTRVGRVQLTPRSSDRMYESFTGPIPPRRFDALTMSAKKSNSEPPSLAGSTTI
jgi:hypothetical protein